MNINITGRHVSISDRLRKYAEKKIKKLEKYFHQLVDAHVIMYIEKLDHGSEVLINGDGIQFHGREKASNFYSSIDLLFEKMEKQIVKYKEKHSSHKITPQEELIPFEYRNNTGKKIFLNQVSNKPIDKIEAYLQMKINESDFILFKKGITMVDSDIDLSNKSYAIIYQSKTGLKLVKIPFDKIKEHKYDYDTFVEYDLNIIDDSLSKPNIEFKKNPECSIKKMTLNEALDEFESSNDPFLAFFNMESQYFNVIYRNGKEFEVMVPAF